MTVTDYATFGLLGCMLAVIAIVADWGDAALQRAVRQSPPGHDWWEWEIKAPPPPPDRD